MVTADLSHADTQGNTALLDSNESSRLARLVMADNRRDYAAAHALLRRTLTEVAPQIQPADWRFEQSPRGKPFLAPAQAGVPPLRFSLAHTRGLVACLVSRGAEVGVDVEAPLRVIDVDVLMRDVCSVDEQQQILSAAPAARARCFLDLWMLKEAYVKALGIGITEALRQVSFNLQTPRAILASTPVDAGGQWWFALLGCTPEIRVGVAIEANSPGHPTLDAAVVDAPRSPSKLSPLSICASSLPASK